MQAISSSGSTDACIYRQGPSAMRTDLPWGCSDGEAYIGFRICLEGFRVWGCIYGSYKAQIY